MEQIALDFRENPGFIPENQPRPAAHDLKKFPPSIEDGSTVIVSNFGGRILVRDYRSQPSYQSRWWIYLDGFQAIDACENIATLLSGEGIFNVGDLSHKYRLSSDLIERQLYSDGATTFETLQDLRELNELSLSDPVTDIEGITDLLEAISKKFFEIKLNPYWAAFYNISLILNPESVIQQGIKIGSDQQSRSALTALNAGNWRKAHVLIGSAITNLETSLSYQETVWPTAQGLQPAA